MYRQVTGRAPDLSAVLSNGEPLRELLTNKHNLQNAWPVSGSYGSSVAEVQEQVNKFRQEEYAKIRG